MKYKYIFWRKDLDANEEGHLYANVHLLVGYNQGSLADFAKMAEELRQTFPQAQDNEIRGGQVSNSRYVQGFTIIVWSAYIPAGEYPGWNQYLEFNGNIQDYYW